MCVRAWGRETNTGSSCISGSCGVKVRGPASCSVALTGSVLPRNKVSVRVCVSLLQSWLDRFLSCFRCEKQEVIVHQSATCRLRCQIFHSTCSSGQCWGCTSYRLKRHPHTAKNVLTTNLNSLTYTNLTCCSLSFAVFPNKSGNSKTK